MSKPAPIKVNFFSVINLITAVFECICFGGLFTAWPAVQYMLESEGYFSEPCSTIQLENTTISVDPARCDYQDRMLGLVFIVPLACMFISAYVIGCIYDRYGTRFTRYMGAFMFNIGCIFISESTSTQSWMLFPGMILYNVGGSAFALITNAQLGNLFPWRSSVITLLVGCTQSSSLTTAAMKIIFERGVSTTWIFRIMNMLSLTVWMRTFLLMPKTFILHPLPEHGYVCELQSILQKTVVILRKLTKGDRHKVTAPVSPSMSTEKHRKDVSSLYEDAEDEVPGAVFYLKAATFVTEVLYTVVLHVRNAFFVATLLPWAGSTFYLDSTSVGDFVGHFSLIQSGVILTAAFNGVIIDLLTKSFRKSGCSKDTSSAKALYASKLITSCLGGLFSLLVCIPSLDLQYVSMLIFVLFRSFIYGGFYALIIVIYPQKHFGKLSGFCQCAWGLCQLLQYPLLSLVQDFFNGNFLIVNVCFCVLSFLTISDPIWKYRLLRKNERKQQQITSVFSVLPV